jgi:hypothetical protein
MTRAHAEAAVNLLLPKYPDAVLEEDTELVDDADDASAPVNDYSVALGGTVADTIDEIVGQLKDDFGDEAETQRIITQLEAIARGVIVEGHDDDPDMQPT